MGGGEGVDVAMVVENARQHDIRANFFRKLCIIKEEPISLVN